MKETTKMSRAVGQLEKMYNTINADLFGGELPTPIITVQSKPGTYGHCSCAREKPSPGGGGFTISPTSFPGEVYGTGY